MRRFGCARLIARTRRVVLRAARWACFALVLWSCGAAALVAEVTLPAPDSHQPIVIAADHGMRWTEGAYEVWVLKDNCLITQQPTSVGAREAVVWIRRTEAGDDAPNKAIVYVEGDVVVESRRGGANDQLRDRTWLGRFYSDASVEVRVERPDDAPQQKPAIFERATAKRDPSAGGAIHRTQFNSFANDAPQAVALPPGTRRIQASRRSTVPFTLDAYQNVPGNEWVVVIDRGVTLLIEGVEDFGTIDISTDRMVIWKGGLDSLDLSGQSLMDGSTPLEIYMEGNIDFRQGDRIVHANRMYYDVKNHVGIVMDAELLSPLPQFDGIVRLKADLIRQLGPNNFLAENAFLTSSRMGQPGYRLQSRSIYYEDKQLPIADPATGLPLIDPETGEPAVEHERLVTSNNNLLFAGNVPVFYWPRFATNLENPNIFLRQIRLKNDRVFGTQVLTDLDAYQLLGIKNPPAGTDFLINADFMSERGFGGGPAFKYSRGDFFGIPGNTYGFLDSWMIYDHGTDNLGRDRRDVPLTKHFRYRHFARHRQLLPNHFQLTGELGVISDLNFLEQYYEKEWDEFKDESTGIELKHLAENRSWSITADVRVNPFFTTTNFLPRADHFWMGQSLLGDWLTWYEHSQVSFARMGVASTPTDPVDAAMFSLLPWEASADGGRFVTRQELDLPFALGPVKVVPYALGELAHWGQDLNLDPMDRAYGQAGIRATLPVWSVNPNVENHLLNVHGLSHKMIFNAEFSASDANEDLANLPLYDQIDDISTTQFRRRFQFLDFGGVTPAKYDPRFYALRSGIGGVVSSPSVEIADDLMALRMGVVQRWQTKRGLPGQRRIIDWMTLATNTVWFPDPERDNFGSAWGLSNYDFRWHVGDRTTLISSGEYDSFEGGNRTLTVGGFLDRPPRGSVYVGFHLLEGPINSHVLNAMYSYRMSPKWISTVGSSVDLTSNGNIGQFGSLTRIGESLLFSVGFNVDASKGNVGANISIEPRFLPKSRLGRVGGAQIPQAGALGLE